MLASSLRRGRERGGSWDLVSKVISTLIGVIIKYNHSYLIYNPNYYVPGSSKKGGALAISASSGPSLGEAGSGNPGSCLELSLYIYIYTYIYILCRLYIKYYRMTISLSLCMYIYIYKTIYD